MPVLVDVFAHRGIGWASLKFPYNEKAKNAIKAIPGSRWIDPDKGPGSWDDGIYHLIRDAFDWQGKAWYVPIELLPLIERDSNFKLKIEYDRELNSIQLDPFFAEKFKPYQVTGAQRCIERDGYMLTFEPRVGKTWPSIAAMCTLLNAGAIDLVVVLYPNSVAGEWERQLPECAGIQLHKLASFEPLLTMEVNKLRETPYLFVGCHYEILSRREKCLARLIDGRRYGIIGDELQHCKNRKKGRYQTFRRLSLGDPIIAESDVPGDELHARGACVSRIGLTGTEMRNRPRDLFGPIDLIRPGTLGGYWSYAKRFCAAVEHNGHWLDKPTKVGNEVICKGSSNEKELGERLALVSMKVTRAEAAPWLPKIDRKVVLCQVPAEMLAKYRKLEQAYGKRITNAMEGSEPGGTDETMIAEMDRATSSAKMDHAIKQCLEHLDRGVKVRISAHHHDTVREFTERFDTYFDEDHPLRLYPYFRAAGYDSQTDRNEAIKRWKDYPSATLLITNNLSTGVGIDLSDGKVSISLEPEYVPADQMQWEDRAVDVHHGKTVEPPLVIYLLVRGTLDEHKVAALISKLRIIKAVVGAGTETDAMASAFRDSGVVDGTRLGLQDDSKSTAAAALNALRERLLRGDSGSDTSLEAEMAGWEDDEVNDPESEE